MSDVPRRLHPKIVDWGYFQDGICLQILIFLLAKAKMRQTTFMGCVIFRGEVVIGRGALVTATGRTEAEIRTRLGWLKKDGVITQRLINAEERDYGVWRLVNFDAMQKEPEKVERKEPTPYMAAQKILMKNDYSEDFDEWWKLYKKGNKRNAWLRWQQLKIEEALPELEKIMKSTQQYLDYCTSIERSRMDAQGWLNQRYFENIWTHEAQGTQPEGEGERVTFG